MGVRHLRSALEKGVQALSSRARPTTLSPPPLAGSGIFGGNVALRRLGTEAQAQARALEAVVAEQATGSSWGRWRAAAGVGVAGGVISAAALSAYMETTEERRQVLDDKGYPLNPVPRREEQVARLRASGAPGASNDEVFDILVIGGGATGTGISLDASTRGLKTAMIEANDFASGTSSKSTKLVHGGVRYLEKAVKHLDYGQLKLVFEALHERKTLLRNAPHLSRSLPIMTPCYQWYELPYFWAGMKCYDALAGSQSLTWSRFVSSYESKRQFPTLREVNSHDETLKGAIVYYDGQFNDSRLCVLLACTAAERGAAVANYCECVDLIKDPDTGKCCGAKVRDKATGQVFDVKAKQVINACGPFSDAVRVMSDPKAKKMVTPSAGVHVTLPDYYSVEGYGMIVPKTKDGRVVFLLPWEGYTIAGTTDSAAELSFNPRPTEKEVNFILESIEDYLSVQVRRSDVSSTWCGIRPLVSDPDAEGGTENLVRDHLVVKDGNGLVTICGGKWTTYRLMAQDAVDAAVEMAGLEPKEGCCTTQVKVVGGDGYHRALHTEIAQSYTVPHRPGAVDTRVAKHLTKAYGDRARVVTRIAMEENLGQRLARGIPEIEAEVPYAVRYEYCTSAEDFLARRTPLAITDVAAAQHALPRVVELLGKELGWGWMKRKKEIRRGKAWLDTYATGKKAH